MVQTNSLIKFIEGGMTHELYTGVQQLKKINNREVLMTQCGRLIDLGDLLSVNGIGWAV